MRYLILILIMLATLAHADPMAAYWASVNASGGGGAAYDPFPIKSGLVFSGFSGSDTTSTYAQDGTGNGGQGTNVGGAVWSSVTNDVYSSAASTYYDFGSYPSINLASNFTVNFWVFIPSYTNRTMIQNCSGDLNYGWESYVNALKTVSWVTASNGNVIGTSLSKVMTGAWNNISLMQTNTGSANIEAHIMVNGTNRTAQSVVRDIGYNGAAFKVGGGVHGAASGLRISTVSVFNRCLSLDERVSLTNKPPYLLP